LCSGANGGLDGPVDGLYTRLSTLLRKSKSSVLRLKYRKPNDFSECIIDILAGCSFLKGIGSSSIVLLGHSFGGAGVITAAQLHKLVCGVVSLSPQRFGTETVSELNMALLLIPELQTEYFLAKQVKISISAQKIQNNSLSIKKQGTL
jgi:dienelactone hydrolase